MGMITILALVSFILQSNRHERLVCCIAWPSLLLPRQGHLFQTTSIGRRKALKNVHLYTCSPCAKRHTNIVTLLVDI